MCCSFECLLNLGNRWCHKDLFNNLYRRQTQIKHRLKNPGVIFDQHVSFNLPLNILPGPLCSTCMNHFKLKSSFPKVKRKIWSMHLSLLSWNIVILYLHKNIFKNLQLILSDAVGVLTGVSIRAYFYSFSFSALKEAV